MKNETKKSLKSTIISLSFLCVLEVIVDRKSPYDELFWGAFITIAIVGALLAYFSQVDEEDDKKSMDDHKKEV